MNLAADRQLQQSHSVWSWTGDAIWQADI